MADYSDKMSKAIEATEREFSKIRAGQASPAILNDVRIDYYGTPTPISQVAKVSVPEPRMLLVSPWEKTMVDPIEKAILAANIGLTPMKDGNCIRVMNNPKTPPSSRDEALSRYSASGEVPR